MTDQPEGRALTMGEMNARLRANRCSPACSEQHTYEPPCQAAVGYCPHCGRGDVAPTADEYEAMRQRAAKAEAALAALHEGERPCPDPHIVPTPGQWLWQWNRATPEQRLDLISRIQSALAVESACRLEDHRGHVERARRDGAALERGRRAAQSLPPGHAAVVLDAIDEEE